MKKIEINKEEIEKLIEQKFSYRQMGEKLKLSPRTIRKYCKVWGIKSNPPRQFDEETRKIISQKRKDWLSKNPEKHPWRRKDKFKSTPCAIFKKWLDEKNIKYIEEFQPLLSENRFYSIDICLPDKMIAIEINGNQHYERNGFLKPYYQKRHELIEAAGWKIYELHYSICFNIQEMENLHNAIINAEIKRKFDYEDYKKNNCQIYVLKNGNPAETQTRNTKLEISDDIRFHHRVKKKYKCTICYNEIKTNSRYCVFCARLKSRKVNRPTKEDLEKLVWEKPTIQIAKEFGVSDVAVAKWCKQYNIQKPKPGYWSKMKTLYIV